MAAQASRLNTVLRNIGQSLTGSTVIQPRLLGQSHSMFDFGVINARQFAATRKAASTTSISRDIALTVQEARDRIREFITGVYAPKRIPELVEYLSARMLRIEERRGRDGRVANYLVDEKTRSSVSAALVDRRLSVPGMAKMFGRTLEAEAKVVRNQRPRSPEEIVAHQLRNANAGRLLLGDAKAAPFADWADLSFSAPSLFQGREFAAQGSDTWVGIVHARASEDAEENVRIIREAYASGRRLIIPARSPEDAKAGRLVAGMPILLRDGAVRTRLISPNLSFDRMSETFGKDPFQHYEDMATNYAAKVKGRRDDAAPNVLDMQSFKKRFARQPEPAAQQYRQDPAIETGAAYRPGKHISIVHTVDENGIEQMSMVDLKSGASERFNTARLAPGTYIKEDSFGLPAGKIVVDLDGGYQHLDDEGRFHNELGPAIVPAQGSSERPVYVINGEIQDRRRTARARAVDNNETRGVSPGLR